LKQLLELSSLYNILLIHLFYQQLNM